MTLVVCLISEGNEMFNLNDKAITDLNLNSNLYSFDNPNYVVGYTWKGEPFFVSYEDYELIKNICWHINNTGYVYGKLRYSGQKVLMHNLIMNTLEVDHINRKRNDNRRCNLRLKEKEYGFNTYNQMNKSTQKNNKSGHPGITWHKRDCVWESYISVGNKRHYIGRYTELSCAIKAREEAEKKYFKEWCGHNYENINMPDINDETPLLIMPNRKTIRKNREEFNYGI